MTCECGQSHLPEPSEHGCTATSAKTWVENRALRFFGDLRDANGRVTAHCFVRAGNNRGTHGGERTRLDDLRGPI